MGATAELRAMPTAPMQTLPLSLIRMDGGTQPRAGINSAAVDDYRNAMEAGAVFPPVIVFYDGTDYWLADGFHRVRATLAAGRNEIACEVHEGTVEDARWFSFGANKTNGERRTRDDTQRAVIAALKHPNSVNLSNVQIAQHVGCNEGTVRAWREKLSASSEIPKMETRAVMRNGRTYQQNVSNIGKAKKTRSDQPVPCDSEAGRDGIASRDPAEAANVPIEMVERANELQKGDPEMTDRVDSGGATVGDAVPDVMGKAPTQTRAEAIIDCVQELKRLIEPDQGRFVRFKDFLRAVPAGHYSEMAGTFRYSCDMLLRISATFHNAVAAAGGRDSAGTETTQT